MDKGQDEEELSIDFSAMKKSFTKFMGKGKSKAPKQRKVKTADDEEELSLNTAQVKEQGKKIKSFLTSAKVLPWTLIIIVILLSTFFRVYPASLPITDEWAANTIASNVKNQMADQVRQGSPYLPADRLDEVVNQQYADFMSKNEADFAGQQDALSQQFKERMRNENGQTYLLAIDPYLWYSYAKWHEKTGFFGNTVVDGQEKFTLRNGRIGMDAKTIWPSLVILWLHAVVKIINPAADLMATTFYLPVILIALAIIPAFFLGRKLGGNAGGFFAAAIFALSSPILGRTTAGFSDTDSYTMIFPFLITWLVLESLEAKEMGKKIALAVSASLAIVLFRNIWPGWWFIYDFALGIPIIYGIYLLAHHYVENQNYNFKSLRPQLVTLFTFFFGALIIGGIVGGLSGTGVNHAVTSYVEAPILPIDFILGFKAAAEGVSVGGDYALWPNVLTTVAELNSASTSQVVSGGGGKFFFYLAIIGILLLIARYKENKKYPFYGVLLSIWFVSTFYAGTVGVRFIALFAPVVAFSIAGVVGYLTGKPMDKISKTLEFSPKVTRIIITVALLLVLLYTPIKTADAVAKNEVPTFTDAWQESLQVIHDSSEQAVITSWWDFGHWFEAMSERSVTFDGADQGKRIHWVGRTLLTSDEEEATSILRMLNCGQEESYNTLLNYVQDKYVATNLLKKIILLSRDEAKTSLLDAGLNDQESEDVLTLTHCDNYYDQYFITSEDMVGKAGVWGHFGSWDFDKAYMYYALREKSPEEAVAEAKDVLGMDRETAKGMYLEAVGIQNEDQANQWISTWPNYFTGAVPCQEVNESVICSFNAKLGRQGDIDTYLAGAIVNLTDYNQSVFLISGVRQGQLLNQQAISPSKILIGDGKDITTYQFDNQNLPFDLFIHHDEENGWKGIVSNPLLTTSLFTKLYFFDGAYTSHFEKISDKTTFTGQRIVVWKVDLS